MDSCQSCQSKIESLATDGTRIFTQLVEHLPESEPIATSAYWPALQAWIGRWSRPLRHRAEAEDRATLLLISFDPASDTAYLGRLRAFRRDASSRPRRNGSRARSLRFAAACNVGAEGARVPIWPTTKLPDNGFAAKPRAAASVTHENVVAVHQVEKSSDMVLPYLVMQLIAGESLEQRPRSASRRPCRLREIVRIGMQAAHGPPRRTAQGLIHRDIKPGNILLEPPHDRVKLTDFGLARVVEDVKLTSTGYRQPARRCTWRPSKRLGEPADHRSDLFSLGAICTRCVPASLRSKGTRPL